MKPHTTNVHIEQLVLDGLQNVDSVRFGSLVSSELSHLLSDRPVSGELQQSGGVEVVDGGRISIGARTTDSSLAGAVAKAIHRGMTG